MSTGELIGGFQIGLCIDSRRARALPANRTDVKFQSPTRDTVFVVILGIMWCLLRFVNETPIWQLALFWLN